MARKGIQYGELTNSAFYILASVIEEGTDI